MKSEKPNPEPIWCIVANVIHERWYGEGGKEMCKGTKHFAPGAKVYCSRALWGDGYEKVQVIGRHRGSHRFVKMIVSSKYLTNWRVELVYSPHVIRELEGHWDGSQKSKEMAGKIVSWAPQVWIPREPPAPEQ